MSGFIPRGYISIHEAVDRIERERFGSEPQRASSEQFGALAASMARLSRAFAGEETPRDKAENHLLDMLANGDMPAEAIGEDGSPNRLPVELWRGRDRLAALREGNAPGFGAVVVSERALSAALAGETLLLAQKMPAKPRSAGGRPPTHDWDEFTAELVEVMALDKGYITRTELRARMKNWAAEHMEPQPDDRTIEKKIDRLVRPNLTSD